MHVNQWELNEIHENLMAYDMIFYSRRLGQYNDFDYIVFLFDFSSFLVENLFMMLLVRL